MNNLDLLVSIHRLASMMAIEANNLVIACSSVSLDYLGYTVRDFVHHVETKQD